VFLSIILVVFGMQSIFVLSLSPIIKFNMPNESLFNKESKYILGFSKASLDFNIYMIVFTKLKIGLQLLRVHVLL